MTCGKLASASALALLVATATGCGDNTSTLGISNNEAGGADHGDCNGGEA